MLKRGEIVSAVMLTPCTYRVMNIVMTETLSNKNAQFLMKIFYRFPTFFYIEQSPPYGLGWLSAQGQTRAVYA